MFFRLQGNPFRNFIHPSAIVDRITTENGLHKVSQQNAGLWQVVVYAR
jgi:hypothetical protein